MHAINWGYVGRLAGEALAALGMAVVPFVAMGLYMLGVIG